MKSAPAASDPGTFRTGLALGLAAYVSWGFAPLYFRQVVETSPWEVLAHRIIWSLALLLLLLASRGRLRKLPPELQERRTIVLLIGTALLVSANWLVFIYAVTSEQLVQASLGYFINPLVNVLLGFLLLGERLRRWQWAAVALAAIGVLQLTVLGGTFPWISLVLAFSFAFYGLLRKIARVDALLGLAVETALMTPLALLYFVVAGGTGRLDFLTGGFDVRDAWLPASGIVTAVPLLLFTGAARRLPLSTVGLLQYIAPSMQLLVAVVLFGEAFSSSRAVAFLFIWAGLILYTSDLIRHRPRRVREHTRHPESLPKRVGPESGASSAADEPGASGARTCQS